MIVSQNMVSYMEKSSWIRRMFEEGARLKAIFGAENVFDFSLGNPDIPPQKKVLKAMADISQGMSHGYMPNAGFADVRETVAAYASEQHEAALSADDIIMSCGAGGGLNVVLKSILDPGDEVIALSPYFVEYGFYVQNHGGSLVTASCTEDFLPDKESIQKAISNKTKAIIINSPNNPTGRVYPEQSLVMLSEQLREYPRIVVISDEPYRKLVYDSPEPPSVLKHIPNSVVVTSASKELSLAGQRIGYIAVNPMIPDKEKLIGAMILATRILGFVNAPALMQRVLAQCIHDSIDISVYRSRRDILKGILDEAGLSYAPPEGTFYLFVKAPIRDDVAFCNALLKERILAVPGTGFGHPGYVRFAYCVDESSITGCSPGLMRVMSEIRR
ncbi:MAG TPA: pyridoxal phosphate-dependent aminotransferase [Deltaproteobacteria bacterium]|nr:pyridoxal phosphate-dependent aminotransferase [Deltaproteobacteria bacterium]